MKKGRPSKKRNCMAEGKGRRTGTKGKETTKRRRK